MKRKWHIKTRLLVTLAGLTCLVLVAVAVAFNISVNGYISSRVSAQLDSVTRSVSDNRRVEREPKAQFDEHPDKIMGTRGSAVVLDENGDPAMNLRGDNAAAGELAKWYRDRSRGKTVSNKTVSLDSGDYAVSAIDDPVEDGRTLLVYVDITAIRAFARQVNLVLLIVIAAAILLSVLLSRRFARTFAAPVQRLSAFASQIGSGDLEPRKFHFRDVEFDELGNSMNRMAKELSDAKQKQETFFQNVSHELRTPLTSIRGNAEGIVYGIIEPQTAGRVILSQSDKLGGMVEDILYLSRMGKGKPEGAAEPIDLREILSLCVSEQNAEAKQKGLSFAFDFDEDPVMLAIREQDAQRLIGNLISNAVRYANREIRLTCRTEGEKALVRVADDGPGIRPEDLPHVFERFYKGEGGKHGIGLAIAHSVAEVYRGRISVRNENGAVFEIVFPAD
ncbi:MAG: HAMP domain-containing histidine kinase [Clostridiales bacterium]|nr:HAMP domain-containing histidine kinase [Clostridiales bacterium]